MKRPLRQKDMLHYIKNMQIWEHIFSQCGGIGHASTAADPRPMENMSLYDLRAEFERVSGAIRQEIPKALWIVFWSNRYKIPIEQGLSVPPETLWWVAQETDTALLSDGFTHHYTSVGKIDQSSQTISFSDPWPDEFFLQAGRNVLGIESNKCTVTRADFERAAIGVLTWDTVELLDAYFDAFGDQASCAIQRLRAGHAIMAAGPEYLASYATKHFFVAAHLADLANDEELAVSAIARAWLGAKCALAAATREGDQLAVIFLEKWLGMALSRAPEVDLMRQLTPDELCRLAHNAGQMGQLQIAEAAASLAIDKYPGFEDAYRLRAITRLHSDPAAAAADASQALDLNSAAATKLEKEMLRLRGGSPFGGGSTNNQLILEHSRRIGELNTLVAAAWNGGDNTCARRAVIELCTLQPDSIDVCHKRLVIESALGDITGIRTAATALLKLDIPPALRAEAETALASLGGLMSWVLN